MTARTNIDTLLVHAGEPEPRDAGSMAIHRSTVWACRGGTSYAAIPYPRLSNLPNQQVLGAKLAAIEEAEAGMVTASGMAAITSALISVLGKGGHVLVQDCLYGGTQSFVQHDLAVLGMEYDVIDAGAPESWSALVRPNTRAVYVEAMTNPTLQVIDHRAVVAFAKQHGLVSMIDNTFATPVNYRPCGAGYDLSLHSATKYLNGHSDVAAGAVIGSAELVDKVHLTVNHFGGSLDPDACYLLYRGLRTLGLRVRRQNEIAMHVAGFLHEHPAVARVNHPGLEDHPQHQLATELFDGFGAMLSFELAGGSDAVDPFLDAVSIPMVSASLGGVESLLTVPARTSHLGQSAEERARMGVGDGLIRMSVGIEDPQDLTEDLGRALEATGSRR